MVELGEHRVEPELRRRSHGFARAAVRLQLAPENAKYGGTVAVSLGFRMTFSTAFATSSGWTGFIRPVASVPSISSVLVNDGSTAPTRMPCSASSASSASLNASTPALVAL